MHSKTLWAGMQANKLLYKSTLITCKVCVDRMIGTYFNVVPHLENQGQFADEVKSCNVIFTKPTLLKEKHHRHILIFVDVV
uniref:Uncharacterized protein n=1 Tax=Anguilla anguilla TaxID=7936 RepID=A0A0E9X5C4_ANGAN